MIFVLMHEDARRRALEAVKMAPDGYVVTVKEGKRNLDQNAKLHATLHDIAKQKLWAGDKLTIEEWKRLFSALLFKEKMLHGLEGGIVIVPRGTSTMTKSELSDLIECVQAWGAENGVKFSV